MPLQGMLKVLQEKRANWARQTKPQATTLISLWFCGYSSCVLIFAVMSRNRINIPESISGVHGFTCLTVRP